MNAIKSDTDAVGVILAAGRGSRMRSRLPKPLHRAAGKPLISYSVELLAQCGIEDIIVVVSPENGEAISAVIGQWDNVCGAANPGRNGPRRCQRAGNATHRSVSGGRAGR